MEIFRAVNLSTRLTSLCNITIQLKEGDQTRRDKTKITNYLRSKNVLKNTKRSK